MIFKMFIQDILDVFLHRLVQLSDYRSEIRVAFHDGVVHKFVDSFCFFSFQIWFEHYFRGSEALIADRDFL